MGVDRSMGVGSGVGVAVGSVVAVGTRAAIVCSTESFTHIWVASMPISGVGAACGLGAQEVNNIMIKKIKKSVLPKLLFPSLHETDKIIYTNFY